MIINRPCARCGISLEKGVKIVIIVDLILGCITTIVWAVLISNEPKQLKSTKAGIEDSVTNAESSETITISFEMKLILLILAVIHILLSILLYIGVKVRKAYICYIWLLATAATMLTNGLLIKIYEMIVVYAFSEEIKVEYGGKALEKFRKLPYVCRIRTQLYPPPYYGSHSQGSYRSEEQRKTETTHNRLPSGIPSVFVVSNVTIPDKGN